MKLLLLLQRNHVHFTRDGAFQNVPLQNNKSSHHTDNIPSHVKTLHIDFLKHHENEVTGSEKLACNSLFEKLTHNPPPHPDIITCGQMCETWHLNCLKTHV